MSENWMALFISIVGEKSIDKSLATLGIRPKIKMSNLTDEEKRTILLLHEKGLTLRQIESRVGRSVHAIRSVINKELVAGKHN